MNILLVTAMFPPIRTGTSYYSDNLANSLSARGHRVRVVTLENSEAQEGARAAPVERLPAWHLPIKGVFNHFRICSAWPGNWRALRRLAQREHADAILLVNHYLDIAFPAIYAARSQRIPLLCSVGTQLQSVNPRRHRLLNFLDRMICGGLVFPFCDRVVAWDNQIFQYLADVHGAAVTDKTAIVNFGPNGDANAAVREDYALQGQILGVGAVTEQRDYTALVRAFALIADRFPSVRLKIVGHVYLDAAVRLAAELGLTERVVFTGELSHDRVLSEMCASDAFFVSLSGRYLGLGTATLEAMWRGVPVVANVPADLLGTVMLGDREHLLRFDGLAPAPIADGLAGLLSDSRLREKVGRGGCALAREYLNWDRVAADMERLIAETLGRTERR